MWIVLFSERNSGHTHRCKPLQVTATTQQNHSDSPPPSLKYVSGAPGLQVFQFLQTCVQLAFRFATHEELSWIAFKLELAQNQCRSVQVGGQSKHELNAKFKSCTDLHLYLTRVEDVFYPFECFCLFSPLS